MFGVYEQALKALNVIFAWAALAKRDLAQILGSANLSCRTDASDLRTYIKANIKQISPSSSWLQPRAYRALNKGAATYSSLFLQPSLPYFVLICHAARSSTLSPFRLGIGWGISPAGSTMDSKVIWLPGQEKQVLAAITPYRLSAR